MSPRGVTWLAGLVACVAIWAGLAWAWRTHNEAMREEGRAEVRAQDARDDAAQAEVNAKETKRRLERQQENDHAQAVALAAAVADSASLRDAGVRQQRRIDQLLAAARRPASNPGPSGSGPRVPGADPLDLLAQLYSRADTEAGQLAEYADQLRIAGERCERDYDALTVPAPDH